MITATAPVRPVSVAALVEAVRAEQATRCVPLPETQAPSIVAVRSAHPGAGGTTVALALLDALGDHVAARRTLIDLVAPAKSGLLGASETETVCEIPGWRRGTRAGAEILRPADDAFGFPPHVDGHVIVDSPAVVGGAVTVVVCRPTLPSLRCADVLIGSAGQTEHLVVVGARRWPKALRRLVPAGVADLSEEGRVTFFPHNRRLELYGPDSAPMPRELTAVALRLAEALWPDLGNTRIGERR